VSESFLTRWSRRKREADQPAPEAAAPGSEPAAPAPTQETSGASSAQPETSAVDLKSLPPIESIAADTDIRAFLAPGIPAQLTRAALRRVWSADPAIRDFVGLSENAWDFNDPASVPGFGPTVAPEDVKRLLAEIMGDADPPPSAAAATESDSLQKPDNDTRSHVQLEETGDVAPAAAEPAVAAMDDHEPQDCAAQDEPAQEQATPIVRRHGGALPS
jgi:hypothetical protein